MELQWYLVGCSVRSWHIGSYEWRGDQRCMLRILLSHLIAYSPQNGFLQASSLIESFISDGVDDFIVTDTTASFYTRVGVIAMSDTATVLRISLVIEMLKGTNCFRSSTASTWLRPIRCRFRWRKASRRSMLPSIWIWTSMMFIFDYSAFNAAQNMLNEGLTPERTYTRQVVYFITDSDVWALCWFIALHQEVFPEGQPWLTGWLQKLERSYHRK